MHFSLRRTLLVLLMCYISYSQLGVASAVVDEDDCAESSCSNDQSCPDGTDEQSCVTCITDNSRGSSETCRPENNTCDQQELLLRCLPEFATDVDWKTFSIHTSDRTLSRICSLSALEIASCLKNHSCNVPTSLSGLILALNFLCETSDYKTHRDCLQRVHRNIDCNVAYPQALPILAYTASSGAWYPQVSSAYNVADGADLIKWSLSTHLLVMRGAYCRHARARTECGQRAADWQLEFSLLLSNTLPRLLDTVRHPDNLHVTYLVDCTDYAHDIAAMDACDAVQLCVPVIDTLLANTHYGVLSFSQLDLRDICSLSPREYRQLCVPAARPRSTFVDRLILSATELVHRRLCGPDRADYARHRECLKRASESASLASCSESLAAAYNEAYNSVRYTHQHADQAAAATCTATRQFLECVERHVVDVCGRSVGLWQRSFTRRMLLVTAYDRKCLLEIT